MSQARSFERMTCVEPTSAYSGEKKQQRKRVWSTPSDSDDDDVDQVVIVHKLARALQPPIISPIQIPAPSRQPQDLRQQQPQPQKRTADHVFDPARDAVATIAAHYATNGFVVVRALTPQECQDNIKAQVKEILLKQPWQQLLVVRDPTTGQELDIDRDTARYINVLTSDNLDKATLAHYEASFPFHSGFGACCDPQAFHLEGMWRVREKVELYDIARTIVGNPKLWVDINRPIQKLPGKGEHEFLHWDLDIMHKDYERDRAIAGKVLFTDGVFICVPGTANAEFQAQFRAQYGPLYPGAKRGDAKFGLDKAKPDPLGLAAKKVAIKVPAGCAVFWSEFLLHGVEKNPRAGHIQFGMYLGYMEAISRAEYARKAKVPELEDRLESFNRGIAPLLWPSMDKIHYYPARYLNFHRMIQPYIEKTRPGYAGLTVRVIKSGPNKGQVVDDIVPVVDANYRAPRLSPLGERLLGAVPW